MPFSSRRFRAAELRPFKTAVPWDVPDEGLPYPAVAAPWCGQPWEGSGDRLTLSCLLLLLLLVPSSPIPHQTLRGCGQAPWGPQTPDWQRLSDLPLAMGAGSPLSFTAQGMFFQTINYLF